MSSNYGLKMLFSQMAKLLVGPPQIDCDTCLISVKFGETVSLPLNGLSTEIFNPGPKLVVLNLAGGGSLIPTIILPPRAIWVSPDKFSGFASLSLLSGLAAQQVEVKTWIKGRSN